MSDENLVAIKVFLCENCGTVEMMELSRPRPRFAGCIRCGWASIREQGSDRPAVTHVRSLLLDGDNTRTVMPGAESGPADTAPASASVARGERVVSQATMKRASKKGSKPEPEEVKA